MVDTNDFQALKAQLILDKVADERSVRPLTAEESSEVDKVLRPRTTMKAPEVFSFADPDPVMPAAAPTTCVRESARPPGHGARPCLV